MLHYAIQVELVQGEGFEPTKHYAPELKSGPFDQLGYPCNPPVGAFAFNRADGNGARTDALPAPTPPIL